MSLYETTEHNFNTSTLIQEKLLSGYKIFGGFGERDSVSTDPAGCDIWRGGELSPSGPDIIPIPPDEGDLISVVSENNNDNISGTGTQRLKIMYLNSLGYEQSTEINMNGTTPIDTGISMRFIQSIHSIQVGTNGVSVGNIKAYKTGDTSHVYSMIADGGNQSVICNRMVPKGKTLYMQSWSCTECSGKRVTIRLRSTDANCILYPGVFIFKDSAFIKSSNIERQNYTVIPELSVVKISCWSLTAGA